jgi:hypothetical protein
MNAETKLPDGLEMAMAHIEELGSIIARRCEDYTGRVHPSLVGRAEREAASCNDAIDAIRHEHAQRLTLQHHAADLAQRVADLEKERDELRARLAELGQQEPVTWMLRTSAGYPNPEVVRDIGQLSVSTAEAVRAGQNHLDPLYARPAPAIPTDPGMLIAGIGSSSPQYVMGWNDCRANVLSERAYATPPAIPAGWLPIETAPKDGTAVLSLLAGSDVAHSVRWLESSHKFAKGTAGWHIVWDLSRASLNDGPEYWMPIPGAPEDAR